MLRTAGWQATEQEFAAAATALLDRGVAQVARKKTGDIFEVWLTSNR